MDSDHSRMKPREVRQAVLVRAGWRCERCHVALGNDYSLHHRRPRGMGGTKRPDLPSNLLALCGSGTTGCHGWVESRRAEAIEDGLLVRQHHDPATVPVLLGCGWVLLRPDGSYEEAA